MDERNVCAALCMAAGIIVLFGVMAAALNQQQYGEVMREEEA